jgi:autotransporter-associated beta strand protein
LVTGGGSLTVSGLGILALSGDLSGFNGPTVVSSGSTLVFSQSANSTYGGNVSGAGTIQKSATSTVTLTGNLSTFTGPLSISGAPSASARPPISPTAAMFPVWEP